MLWRRKGDFNLPQLWGKVYSHLLGPVSCADPSPVLEAEPEESSRSVPGALMLLKIKQKSATQRLFGKGGKSLFGFFAV